MPKGPNGQKRPADVIGAANMVARIATGEIEETPIEPRGFAGGKARAKALTSSKRSEIASLAAKRRWQGERQMNMQSPEKKTVARGHEAVRMYPNNKLGPQAREFSDAFSGFQMLRSLVKGD
jgi:hypothetical protein